MKLLEHYLVWARVYCILAMIFAAGVLAGAEWWSASTADVLRSLDVRGDYCIYHKAKPLTGTTCPGGK